MAHNVQMGNGVRSGTRVSLTLSWLGSYYRQLLARKVQQLGYEIYETQLEKGQSFEINTYTREQIEEFSKRSRQIVESLQS